MYQLLIGLYVLVCFLLVVVILMQSGRGGGLVESFSAADTLFGGKTNIYMVRITIVLGSLFLLLALGLNYFVVQKSKSVMERLFNNRPAPAAPMTAGAPFMPTLPAVSQQVSQPKVEKNAPENIKVKNTKPEEKISQMEKAKPVSNDKSSSIAPVSPKGQRVKENSSAEAVKQATAAVKEQTNKQDSDKDK